MLLNYFTAIFKCKFESFHFLNAILYVQSINIVHGSEKRWK